MWLDYTMFRPADISHFYYLVTNRSIDPAELMRAGRKLQNLERSFNLLHAGFERKDDMPPARFCETPVSRGPYKGERLEVDKWNDMLDSYYRLHAWDVKTGRPFKQTLLDLGLQIVVDAMERHAIQLG